MPPKLSGANPNFGKTIFRPLALPRAEKTSLFVEYYYPALGVLFLIIATFGKAAGMSFYDATITGLWIAAIVFFVSQVIRYLKEKGNPKAEKTVAVPLKPVAQVRPNKPKPASKPVNTVKPPPESPPAPAVQPTLNAKPYDKPFISPYAKKRLPETPRTDKKPS